MDTGIVGTDAIKVGLLYQPGVVTPVGSFEVLDSSVDPRFIDAWRGTCATFTLTLDDGTVHIAEFRFT